MKYKRLDEVASYINGYAFKPEQRGIKGLPIIRIQDLTGNAYDLGFYDGEYPKKIEINNGDVLISWSASLGVYVWNKGKALLNQHIFKVSFDKEVIDKKYFIYAVRYKLDEMAMKTHGATMKHIVKKDFDAILIPYPSIQEQENIALKLDIISRILENRKSKLRILDELIKARFIEMFGTPFINEKKWELTQIKNIITDVRYGTSKPSTETGKYKYLRMNNLTSTGRIDLTNIKYIDLEGQELEKCLVHKGDILFNRTNSIDLIGKTADFDLDEDMVIAGYIIRVRLKDNILPKFFSMYFNTYEMKKYLSSIAKGAVNQANINAQELQAINIFLPPIELQNEFADFVREVDKSRYVSGFYKYIKHK